MIDAEASICHVQRNQPVQMRQAIDVSAVAGIAVAVDVRFAVPPHEVLLAAEQRNLHCALQRIGHSEVERNCGQPRILAVERNERAEGF